MIQLCPCALRGMDLGALGTSRRGKRTGVGRHSAGRDRFPATARRLPTGFPVTSQGGVARCRRRRRSRRDDAAIDLIGRAARPDAGNASPRQRAVTPPRKAPTAAERHRAASDGRPTRRSIRQFHGHKRANPLNAGVTHSGNAATPAGGESGGRHTVRLWGGRAGPVFRGKSVANLKRKTGHRQRERIPGFLSLCRFNICCPIARCCVECRSISPSTHSIVPHGKCGHMPRSHSGNTHSKHP